MSIAQEIAIKIEMSGEFPQIVEVLHSGVDHPQFHECLKLLGDLIALAKAGRIDFGALAGIATEHIALAPSLFYIFRMLRSSFGIDVPSEFIEAVNIPVHASGTDFADFGDPLAKILGVRFEVTVNDM